MSPRKYVPIIIGALLLAALLLIPKHTYPEQMGKTDGESVNLPAIGELIIDKLTDIHVNVSLPEDQFRKLAELNQNFMMKYPYIQVKLTNEPVTGKAYELWKQQSGQGEAADVMLLYTSWVKPFAVSGFLKAADSMLTGDVLSDQMTGLLEPLKWNGYLWGVPKDVNPYIVVWNSAMLAEAGLRQPPSDWASYQSLTAKVIENHGGSILNWSEGNLYQQLVWLATFDTRPDQLINLNKFNEEQISKLNWLQAAGGYTSRIKTEAADELAEAFLNNKLLAAILPWEAYVKLNAAVQNRLLLDQDQIYFPWLNGRSYVISSSSGNGEEAMLWIQDMTRLHHQQLSYDQFGHLPARASFYSLNYGIESEQSRIPPTWWDKVLNAKQPEDQLPLADPLWPERWLDREQLWRLSFQEELQMDAYINAVNMN